MVHIKVRPQADTKSTYPRPKLRRRGGFITRIETKTVLFLLFSVVNFNISPNQNETVASIQGVCIVEMAETELVFRPIHEPKFWASDGDS